MTSQRRKDQNQVWCQKNVTPTEHADFWKSWRETQWGMPTFAVMRLCIETRRNGDRDTRATGTAGA